MSAARLFAAFAAFAVCALHGAVRRSESGERLKRTEGLLSDVRRLGPLVGSLRLPLASVSLRLAHEGSEAQLWEHIAADMEAGHSFAEAYSRAPKPRLCPEADAVMGRLSASLGAGDTQTAVSAAELAADELSRIARDERARALQRGKLAGSLSTLFGLGLALLIL